MIPRVVLLAGAFIGLLPLSALAQLQVFEFNGTTDTPVVGTLNIGTTPAGATLVTRLHVRNAGDGPAVLQTIVVSGAGFTVQAAPSLPYTLAPFTGLASEAEIDIAFSPTISASYSATLIVNNLSIILEGAVAPAAAASAVLTVGSSTTPLSAGGIVNFGSVNVGSTQTLDLLLTNTSAVSIDVATLSVTGAGFAGPTGLTAPVQLTTGQMAPFQVSFTPQSGTVSAGVLTVGQQTFNLEGQGVGSTTAAPQLEIFQIIGTTDTPVGALVNVGAAAPGDTVTTRFHVRNTGAGPATLQTVSLAGDGFTILSFPSLPYTISPYVGPASEAEIDINFSPTIVASYSANLLINTTSIALLGTASPAAIVTLAASNTPLNAGATVDFGSVDVGSDQTQGFVLTNSGTATIDIATLAVSGTGFAGPIGLSAPVQLTPGQPASFQISFTPQSGAAALGVLTVGTRTFNLKAQGQDLPLPGASIAFASTVGASGQQNSVTIPLASASPVSASGTLTLAFQSSVSGVSDDPSIVFAAGPHRIATVNVSKGDSAATFAEDGASSMTFQTGSTAGTITFTLTLNGKSQQAALTIHPSAISVADETFSAVRLLGSLNVSFGGIDNTYSASELAFTFYDLSGKMLPQGAIDVDAAGAFKQYFKSLQAGGMFQVLAEFPVTGSTALIGSVTVQMTNSMGQTPPQQITFVN